MKTTVLQSTHALYQSVLRRRAAHKSSAASWSGNLGKIGLGRTEMGNHSLESAKRKVLAAELVDRQI